jgi:hypothetical protein
VTIRDPYAVPGTYRKAQLHCHTRRSDGAFEPLDLARRYRDAGYAFVCLTDHDRVTRCDEANDAGFIVLPGVEETMVRGLRPLGPHLGRILVDNVAGAPGAEECIRRTIAAGGVAILNHPSWPGNLWTGAWSVDAMNALPGPFLVEIWNPHSNPREDVRRWAATALAHGPRVFIGAAAGDDCHTTAQFNQAWVMVRVAVVTAAALRNALLAGAFYASTGVEAEFRVEGSAVTVSAAADQTEVFDAAGRSRALFQGGAGRYEPAGDECFVRLECRAGPRRAWSQAFWIGAPVDR